MERHTHWQLFKTAGVQADDASLAFHPETNSAIILAPDGIEISALPYQIDLFNLTIFEIGELPIKVQRSAPGLLRIVTLFYSRPADYANTDKGNKFSSASWNNCQASTTITPSPIGTIRRP